MEWFGVGKNGLPQQERRESKHSFPLFFATGGVTVPTTPKDLGIVLLEKDIRLLSTEEISFHFGSARSGRIVLTRVFKSAIWQAYTRIQSGEESPIIGNLRTFFYRFIKPIMQDIPENTFRKDPYETMLEVFEELVMDEQLFQYADFDLTDENWQNRHLGTKHPHILVFAEKTGWSRFLRRWHEELGFSVLALGGFPSALSSEYTVRAMREVLAQDQKVRTIGIVDYDPSGWSIAKSFIQQLSVCGLNVEDPPLLIHPKHYQTQEIDMFAFSLPKRQPTKQAKWMELSGGIEGQPKGLEAESMPLERIDRLLRAEINRLIT
ncbi:MAG: hypothetical protein AAGJ35_00015 [Myxococcota bacterium]